VAIESPSEPPRPLAPDARATLVSMQPWPFRQTLALRPGAGGERTLARLPLDVPERARLLTAVSVNPQLWHYPPIPVTFELAVVDAGGREVVFSRRLSPTTQFADRGWFEVDVPLSRWAGRSVTLELSTAIDEPEGESLLMAGWADPRLLTEGEAAPR
jgi:hypothetical protein